MLAGSNATTIAYANDLTILGAVSAGFVGSIGEVLIYDAVLSSDDRALAEAELLKNGLHKNTPLYRRGFISWEMVSFYSSI